MAGGGRAATALLVGKPIAWFGELSHGEQERRKLRQPVYLAEIDLAAFYALPLRKTTARELSRYQAVDRDFSFTFPDGTVWETIEAALRGLEIAELERLTPEEVFCDAKGKTVPEGHYALLVRCVFQSNERTLREEELTEWTTAILAALGGLGGVLRA